MLRRGLQRVRLALQDGVASGATSVESSGPRAAEWCGFVGNWLGRGVSTGASTTSRLMPMNPQLFNAVKGMQGQNGTVSGLFRRLLSSGGGNKPRGFEHFKPRSASHKPTSSASKAEAKKAAESATGGSGGSGGAEGGGDGDPKVNININATYLLLGLGALYLWNSASPSAGGGPRTEISFQEFRSKLLATKSVARLEVVNGNTVRVYVRPDSALDPGYVGGGVYKYFFQVGSVDAFERKLDEAQRQLGWEPDLYVPVKYVNEINLVSTVLEMLPSLLLLGAAFWMVNRQMRSMTGGLGGGLGGMRGGKGGKGGNASGFFGMMRANVSTLDKAAKEKITFKDVAGCDEAKLEIMEFVDFLKKPEKYRELGAKIPKGALLVGPPGTGKTLLAKATAGEAAVPFLSISGSDFMEMFVGVGPARVRDLFAQARSQAPSIIFIDEIDAIGRARGRGGAMGGHDERENTLNQLLVEMDGFATTSGVVVLAGTNRPDILDKALLRPGRFDRTITVDTPDINGREQIFRVHLGRLKLAHPVETYSERLAALTPGMSGADIANVCNEAALVAARHDKGVVDLPDFESAIDRVIGGLEKKNKVISVEERKTVAFHESGHAVVSWFLQYAEPLLKVSIVPRGSSVLGFAQYLPNEHLLMTKEQLLDRLCALLGGRAAEQVLLGKISTGAVNDLERVTQMAYSQVAVYGMNDKVGMLSYRMDREAFDKPYSNETAHMIDTEVRSFVDDAYKRTLKLVEDHKDLITAMSNELLKKEVLNLDDVERILGKRPYESAELRNIDRLRRSVLPPPQSPPSTPGSPPVGGGSGGAGGPGGEEESPEPALAASTSAATSAPASEGGQAGGKGGRRLPPGSVVAT